jgi:hypothetical protein
MLSKVSTMELHPSQDSLFINGSNMVANKVQSVMHATQIVIHSWEMGWKLERITELVLALPVTFNHWCLEEFSSLCQKHIFSGHRSTLRCVGPLLGLCTLNVFQ